MSATTSVDAGRRERWLKRFGFVGWLISAEAADLLDDRRRVRRRAVPWTALGVAVAVTLWVSWMQRGHELQGARRWIFLAFEAALLITALARSEAIRRGEVALGRTLLRRFTRAEAVTVRTVLGGRVMLGLLAMVALQSFMAVVLFDRQGPNAGWMFLGMCAAGYATAAWIIGRITSRPVLAVDPLTLAADDRLRTDDSVQACLLITLGAASFGFLSGSGPSLTLAVLSIAPTYVNLLFAVGMSRTRWAPGKKQRPPSRRLGRNAR